MVEMSSWLLLSVAILFEVAGTICMKLSEGFSRLWPSVLIFIFYGLSFALLPLALKKIDLSLVYAVWSGVGTALIAMVGFLYFKETVTPVRIAIIFLIIIGVVGLNLSPPVH